MGRRCPENLYIRCINQAEILYLINKSKQHTMKGKTFAEKIMGAEAGAIVFRKQGYYSYPRHTSSIAGTLQRWEG
jgi:hypothetical protein